MKRIIEFGIYLFELTFIVLDTKSWENTQYRVDSIKWADTKEPVTIAEYEIHGGQPALLESFETYLEAILPDVANDRKPLQKAPADYHYRTYEEMLADRYDEGIDEVRDSYLRGDARESASKVVRDTENEARRMVSGSFDPFRSRSHTAYWQGDITLISVAF